MPPALAERRASRGVTRLPVPILLAATGLGLVAAGALLGWQRGTLVAFGDSLLAAVAWCF